MKTEKKILAAFLLNLAFSAFEFFGGLFTGSVAILSDAIHDLGDAVGIGLSWILERRSKKAPDQSYTFGYARYSVLGSLIVTLLLVVGSVTVIVHSVERVFVPTEINYNAMILFAIVGVIVNGAAAYFTHAGQSLNQRAVSLHMLEDVLGWVIVLVGAVVMRFTEFTLLDPILSICVAFYILAHAVGHLKEGLSVLLEKAPVDVSEITRCMERAEGISSVHHVHVWSLDGQRHCATVHVVTQSGDEVKERICDIMRSYGVTHVTVQTESEPCNEIQCQMEDIAHTHHHH